MAGTSPAQDLAKNMKQAAANFKEYQENIKSPFITLAASVSAAPVVTLPFWPLDVMKNHLMAGKGSKLGLQRAYSKKGLGIGLLGASVLGLDMSNSYIRQYGHSYSFTKKALIGLAPLSLIPLGSVLENLKINAQISQTPVRQCFRNIIQASGYKGLFRGIVPYSSLFLVTYFSITLPIYYSQKPDQSQYQDMEQVVLHPALVFSSLVLATPIDIIKTKAMLGEKITVQSLKMCPRQLAGIFALRTFYLMALGGVSGFFGNVVEQIFYIMKNQRYQEKKKAKYFAKDDEFDGFIPDDLNDIETDEREFVRKVLTK